MMRLEKITIVVIWDGLIMKTLIINGSLRQSGDTAALVDELIQHLDGEIKIISHSSNISPCVDCRYCWNDSGCSIDDEMRDVYTYLNECDNIVLASPIWFSSLSGPTLNIASRLQTLYAAKAFRHERNQVKPKNGVIMIVGAEKGTEIIPTQIALTIMKLMGVSPPCMAMIYSLNTNSISTKEDKAALAKVRESARWLNQLNKNSEGGKYLNTPGNTSIFSYSKTALDNRFR